MRIPKTIRLFLTFYSSFFFASLVVNACCLRIFWIYGLNAFSGLFWLKIASLGIIFYIINIYKHKEYYYYLNLGVSKAMLWATTLTLDFALYIFLINQAHTFK